jgi:citrate lyase alpha subunit
MIGIRNRYSKVILMLTEFIESFVEKDPTILQRQNDILLDIDSVKDAQDLREVEPETLVALGLVLLK